MFLLRSREGIGVTRQVVTFALGQKEASEVAQSRGSFYNIQRIRNNPTKLLAGYQRLAMTAGED
jgi:hypothetical protein